jgi:CRISPR type III-A-associated RAMP protein Csm4
VLSDAFPFNYFPIPETVRLSVNAQSKKSKRARWLNQSSFMNAQRGESLSEDDFLTDDLVLSSTHIHNTLSRSNDATDSAGGLFATTDYFGATSIDGDDFFFSVYARIEEEYVTRLSELFRLLSEIGFGADTSTGKGQFEVISDFEQTFWIDSDLEGSDGVVVLSTFQPAETDSVVGVWESFVKFAKIGPDFGLESVFKRPLLLFKPGACFKTQVKNGFVGRCVPMDDLLGEIESNQLRRSSLEVNQLCFGLSVPHAWSNG